MLIPPQSGINKFVSKMRRKNIDSAAEGLTLFFWIRTFLDTLILWIRFGYVLDTLWIRFGYGGPNLDTLCIRVFWIRFGYVMDTFWIRTILDTLWIRFGSISLIFHGFASILQGLPLAISSDFDGFAIYFARGTP